MQQQTFDIQTGMPVFGANGESIGTVTAIVGFGSTRIDDATDATAKQVTEAQTGTGHFTVEGAGNETLYVPFHGIKNVVHGHGVTLTADMIDELRSRAEAPPRQPEPTPPPPSRWNLGHLWRRRS